MCVAKNKLHYELFNRKFAKNANTSTRFIYTCIYTTGSHGSNFSFNMFLIIPGNYSYHVELIVVYMYRYFTCWKIPIYIKRVSET